MRFALAAFLLLATNVHAQEKVLTIRDHAQLAAEDLVSIPECDRPFQWYWTFAAIPDRERSEDLQRTVLGWLPYLSFEANWTPPRMLDGGRLWALDLRCYKWNAAARAAVGERETYCEEPAIHGPLPDKVREYYEGLGKDPGSLGQVLRDLIGYQLPDAMRKQNRFPVVAMIRADWLHRDSMETARSSTYYDLLYAHRRFVGTKKERRVVYHPGGDFRHPDGKVIRNLEKGNYHYDLDVANAVQFVDFPKDEDDWNEIYGIAATGDFLKKAKVRIDFGSIAPGARDDKNGSMVAWSNRVLKFERTPFGHAMKSFDVKDTGLVDFVEKAVEVAAGDIPFEAGELLASQPNGAQASLLIDGKRKRIEKADPDFARNTLDPHYVDVRVPMGCVTCHVPDAGVIMPRNRIKEAKDKGLRLKKLTKEQEIEFDRFFLGWERRIQPLREPLLEIFERTAANPAGGSKVKLIGRWAFSSTKAWTPADFQAAYLRWRNEYDRPVSIQVAADELGVPAAALKVALSRGTSFRGGAFLLEGDVPRSVWERTLYRESSLLLSIPDPLKRGYPK